MNEFKPTVAQSNDFIRNYVYSQELSTTDIKVFKAILSKIKHNDTLFEEFYQINYDTLDLAGVSKRDRFQEVSKSLEKLAGTYVRITEEQRKKADDVTLKASKGDRKLGVIRNDFIFDQYKCLITYSVPEILKPHFLELSKRYTIYELENLQKLKSPIAIKLYELLASWANKESFFIKYENLRDMLDIKEDVYPKYGNFKQKILLKYLKDISTHTNITADFTELGEDQKAITSRKKVAYLSFKVFDKNKMDDDFKNITVDSLAKKSFIDKSGKEYLILKVLEKEGLYNLRTLNMETEDTGTLPNYMKKTELLKLIIPNLTEDL